MQKTQEVLAGLLVDYGQIATIRALNPPKIEKITITKVIKCQNYDKAAAKFDQKLERVRKKISSIEQDLTSVKEVMARADRETTHFFGAPKDPSAIAKHNHWVEQGRAAVGKHNELIDRHNEATEEAKEQLHQLEEDAKAVIDEDVVAVLVKMDGIAHKLESSPNASDDMAAIEVCFLGMKIYTFFDDHIEGNVPRRAARDANAELAKLLASLCGSEECRNHITDIYQRNLYLSESNGEVYQQLQTLLSTVDQTELRDRASRLGSLVGRQFNPVFDYAGVVDPSELETITVNIRKAIKELEAHCSQIERETGEAAAPAQKAVGIHKAAEAMLGQLKAGVAGLEVGILVPADFLCEIIDQETIDDFFPKDIKPAVNDLRRHLAESLGEDKLDQILTDTDDVHFLGRGAKAVSDAALMKLETLRGHAPGAVATAQGLKKRLEDDLVQIREVPKQNADKFSAEVGTKYLLSLLPGIGVFLAGGVLGRVNAFKAGFTSSNDIYRDLAQRTIAKNGKFVIANVVVGVGLGLIALISAVVAAVGAAGTAGGSTAAAGGGAGVVLAGLGAGAYLLTALILFMAGRKLSAFTSSSSAVASVPGAA